MVDTDCHHGDGSQNIYWNDPDTLCISIHQDGRTLYPGSGFHEEFGGPNALGTTLNIPLPPRTSDEGFLYIMKEAILPILSEFKPDLVINSAGQDNHFSDPITDMRFSAHGYATLNEMLSPTSPFWRAVIPSKKRSPTSMWASSWPWPASITATCGSRNTARPAFGSRKTSPATSPRRRMRSMNSGRVAKKSGRRWSVTRNI